MSPDCCSTKRWCPDFALPVLRIETVCMCVCYSLIIFTELWLWIGNICVVFFTWDFGEGKTFQNLRVSSPAPVTIVCHEYKKIVLMQKTHNSIISKQKYEIMQWGKNKRLTCPSGETARYRTRNVWPVRVANCKRRVSIIKIPKFGNHEKKPRWRTKNSYFRHGWIFPNDDLVLRISVCAHKLIHVLRPNQITHLSV